jgi:AcrR family transcriptional regulator
MSYQLWYETVPTQEDCLKIAKKRSARIARSTTGKEPLRNRIVAAAFTAFMRNGYAATSMLEIATRAKVSKRDLYANFPSKQSVLLACITSRAARMRLPPDLPDPKSREVLAATLRAYGATVIREVCEPSVTAMYRLAICEAERSPAVAETLNASRFVNRYALEKLLAQAQGSGILRRGDPSRMMEQFFALLWGDLLISRLLGTLKAPAAAEIECRAGNAEAAFLALHGVA